MKEFLFLLCFAVVFTGRTLAQVEIIDDDTFAISDDLTEGIERSSKQLASANSGENSDIRIVCKTPRGIEGQCKTFSECYPILALRNPSKYAYNLMGIRSSAIELEKILRNVTGPCSKEIFETVLELTGGGKIPREEFVCCPSDKVTIKKKPSRPPAQMKPTVTSSCGRVFLKPLRTEDIIDGINVTNYSEEEPDQRIVMGRPAKVGEFPWMVALMNRGHQFCGGSLIDNMHVLTAAHCIHHMNRDDVARLRLYIGDHNIYSTSDGTHVVRGATNIYYHRGFSMRTLYDDVAVIRLNSPVTYTNRIQPICLSSGAPPYDHGNSYANVCGWGKVSERGQQSAILNAVSVRVLTQNKCINDYKGKAPAGISRGMVCAGNNGYDSCQGDSGGPLSRNLRGRMEQIGIVSWGIGCGRLPGVYTRVDRYADWINKNRR